MSEDLLILNVRVGSDFISVEVGLHLLLLEVLQDALWDH